MLHKRTLAAISFCTLLLTTGGLAASAKEYIVDAAHSKALFKIKHLGISTVTGQFADVKGSINYEPNDLAASSTRAVIKVDSVDTGINAMNTCAPLTSSTSKSFPR